MSQQDIVIVGGGISGLSAAYYLSQQQPTAKITVLEKEDSVGGTARSDQLAGYTIDQGANGFLTNVPETLELAESLGLSEELQPATEAAKHRYLYFDGALRALPGSPLKFFGSDLLSPLAKARVALEPFAVKRDPAVDETVYDFAKRRLGKEFAEVFISSMVLGITAGDAKTLSLGALFPRMRQLEDKHGGLLKGMLAQQREAKKQDSERQVRGGPAGPGGRLTSFKQGGVARLIQALREQLGSRILTGAELKEFEQNGEEGGYRLRLASGEMLNADAVILATPAFVTAELLASLLPEAVADLKAIPYAGVSVLGLGYDRIDVPHSLDGFGFLVPRNQGVRILGCLWTSTLFPQQAPDGKVLLRVIAGGVHDPEFVLRDDEEALDIVRRDLERSMGITAVPELVHQIRWPQGIPQYVVGHQERVARIMKAAKRLPGLQLSGNAYYGIALNDCVRDANRVAKAVASA